MVEDVGSALTGKYVDFRRSDNIEDRRDNSRILEFLDGLRAQMVADTPSMDQIQDIWNNPFTMQGELAARRLQIPPHTPLSLEAGTGQLDGLPQRSTILEPR